MTISPSAIGLAQIEGIVIGVTAVLVAVLVVWIGRIAIALWRGVEAE